MFVEASDARHDARHTMLKRPQRRGCTQGAPRILVIPVMSSPTSTTSSTSRPDTVKLDRVVIRFAGDSGDGMQLTGDRFTAETAVARQRPLDAAQLPRRDPRAPGTLPGVSSFQLHFADHDILTPGDAPDVLVAMNPAALKANLADLPRGATIIVNTDEFTKRNLAKVGYADQPARGRIARRATTCTPLAAHVDDRRGPGGVRPDAARTRSASKNMFALGLLSWLYTPADRGHERVPETSSRTSPRSSRPTSRRCEPGYNYGETTEDFAVPYEVEPAPMTDRALPQHHRQRRARLGLVAASHRAGLPLFLGVLPDHPGLRHPAHARRAQALRRDDDAGRGRDRRRRRRARAPLRRRARRDDHLGSGPRAQGRDHRPRRVARAAARHHATSSAAGPRPGCRPRPSRPTCCRRCSAATASRRCRSSRRESPADCFDIAVEAVRIAIDLPHAGHPAVRRLPRQRLRAVAAARTSTTCPTIDVGLRDRAQRDRRRGRAVFHPYLRDPETLARPWAIPGTPGSSTAIGGIEKADITGNISYDPDNHDHMIRLRAGQDRRHRRHDRTARGRRPDGDAERARARLGLDLRPDRRRRSAGPQGRRQGRPGAPAPPQPVPGQHRRGAAAATTSVIVPEMNLGQLAMLLRAKYLVDVESAQPVRGLPFSAAELEDVIQKRSDRMTRHVEQDRPGMTAHGLVRSPHVPRTATLQTDEGLHHRPGGALVPRLRRLRDPRRRAGLPAGAGHQAARTRCSSRASAARRGSRTT